MVRLHWWLAAGNNALETELAPVGAMELIAYWTLEAAPAPELLAGVVWKTVDSKMAGMLTAVVAAAESIGSGLTLMGGAAVDSRAEIVVDRVVRLGVVWVAGKQGPVQLKLPA